ncbi:hypothetical protein PG996_006824 [Apiospora saccharicola]|uniref:Uncharacterized protein n=1 Tax=Apiospora saccharicola TaxID=335842 RepID=A0ABR1V934_9PEZI
MYGLYSPSENLGGKRQHWQARNYIVHPDSDMGAVIEVRDGDFRPGTIDVCELQALVILLDRQMMCYPEKGKAESLGGLHQTGTLSRAGGLPGPAS